MKSSAQSNSTTNKRTQSAKQRSSNNNISNSNSNNNNSLNSFAALSRNASTAKQKNKATATRLVQAPTSLANLAQFSGITLLPIGSNAISLPSDSSFVNKLQTNSSNGSNQPNRPLLFGLSSIPSVQLINQTSATPINMRHETSKKVVNEAYQPCSQMAPSTARSQANGVKRIELNQSTGHIVPELSHLQMPTTNIDQSRNTTTSQLGSPDQDKDIGNFTLMKLMAILNNPALTITPVNPARTSSDPLDASMSTGRAPIKEEHPHPRPFRAEMFGASRIPQSAANLQALLRTNNDPSPAISSCPDKSQNLSTNNIVSKGVSNRCQNSSILAATQRGKHSMNFISGDGQFVPQNTTSGQGRDTLTLLSTSVQNLIMQQQQQQHQSKTPLISKATPTISVELLKQSVGRDVDHGWGSSENRIRSLLETDCVPSLPSNLQQLVQGAKRIETEKLVSTAGFLRKKTKRKLTPSKYRLFQSVEVRDPEALKSDVEFGQILVEDGEKVEVYVSEQHQILETMLSEAEKGLRSTVPEPDEIFINRPKRVMSKIDTMIERKKKRRFERISGRAAPKTNSIEEQCAESEAEWSEDENFTHDSPGFIKSQLPLEEETSKEKRDHLSSVGLISRKDRSRLMIEQCEEKLKLVSPLTLEETFDVSMDDIQKFAKTISETGGADAQWRIESNIRRNDLPFIEGLNRNTSRMKLAFMNALGLDKRSKRTTLYRVRPLSESSNVALPKQSEIDNTMVKSIATETRRLLQVSSNNTVRPSAGAERSFQTVSNLMNSIRLGGPSCRDMAVKIPDKNEYMKSLGLMAS